MCSCCYPFVFVLDYFSKHYTNQLHLYSNMDVNYLNSISTTQDITANLEVSVNRS